MFRLLTQVRKYCWSRQSKSTVQNAFGKYLLFTNTWTSGVLMVVGDLFEQEIEYQEKLIASRYHWGRIGRMFITGLAFGPLHHYFYGWLNKALPQRTLKYVTVKVLIDQLTMSPVCIVIFFYTMGFLEGKRLNVMTTELKEKFMPIYVVDWCVWVPTQFINFYYLPVKYQVLYINTVTMLYNVFLSYIKHKDEVRKVSK